MKPLFHSRPPRHSGAHPPALRLLAALCASLLLGLGLAGVARASDVITATGPAPVTMGPGTNTITVPGASVTDSTNASDTLLVTLATTKGSLSLPSNTSNLTLSYGYGSFSGSTFSFTGTAANVDSALNGMTFTGDGTEGTATITVNATQAVSGINYLPSTGHYYEYVANSGISWTAAQAAANALSFDGQEGYLATDTNATVNDFIDSNLSSNAYNVWAGGEANAYGAGPLSYSGNGVSVSDAYRIWYWGGPDGSPTPGQTNYGGPLSGQAFTACSNADGSCAFLVPAEFGLFFYDPANIGAGTWYYANSSDQEPNNTNDDERYLSINYSPGSTNAGTGKWNDLSDGGTTSGYIVEFGTASGPRSQRFYIAATGVALSYRLAGSHPQQSLEALLNFG